MKIVLPLPPPLNKLYRPNFGNRRGVQKTQECKNWEEQTYWHVRSLRPEIIEKPQHVFMTVDIFYKTERDIDSSQKILQDVLQGLVYDDDKQIKKLVVEKHKDNANPRIEVEAILMYVDNS